MKSPKTGQFEGLNALYGRISQSEKEAEHYKQEVAKKTEELTELIDASVTVAVSSM